MSPGNMCHRGTYFLTGKYVGPTFSLGIVAGQGFPYERSPSNIPRPQVVGETYPFRQVAEESHELSLGKRLKDVVLASLFRYDERKWRYFKKRSKYYKYTTIPMSDIKTIDFSLWAIRMQIILEANGLWEMIEPNEKTQAGNRKDKTAFAFLYQALPEDQLLQITKHKTKKAIWDALKTRHIGEERVQQARLQTLKSDFEMLHMKEDETIEIFTTKLTTLVNKAASLGHTMEDETLVRKLLNVVPDREHFKELEEEVSGKVRFGDGSYIEIKRKGSILIECDDEKQRIISHVYYIPDLKSNLLSLGQFTEIGCKVVIEDDELRLYDMDNKISMKVTRQRNRLYKANLRIDDRSTKMVYIGNEQGSKAYRLFDPTTQRVCISRDVKFKENETWDWKDYMSEHINDEPKWTNFKIGNLEVSNEHYDQGFQPIEDDNEFPNNNDDYASPTRDSPLHSQTPNTPSTPSSKKTYAAEILERVDMHNCHSYMTLVDTESKLEADGT
nr:zinc finger, CCHC-type [Tanacetum cinerariifolium]